MTWNRVGIFLPTYGRAYTKLPLCLKSCVTCAEDRNRLYFVFVVQDKSVDPQSHHSIKHHCGELGVAYEIIVDQRSAPSLARFYNAAYETAHDMDPAMLVSMVGDDMCWKTPGWEAELLDKVNKYNGDGIFYCAGDERFDDALCVNAFMSRQWVDKCGGWPQQQWPSWVGKYNLQWGRAPFMCPIFAANGIDVVWQWIGDATGLSYYLSDIKIKHYQWSRKEIGHDATSSRLSAARVIATRQERRDKEDMLAADAIIKHLYSQGIGNGKTCAPIRALGIRRNYPGRHHCSIGGDHVI